VPTSKEVATRARASAPAPARGSRSMARPGTPVVSGQVISRVDQRAPRRPSPSRQRVPRGSQSRGQRLAANAGQWGKSQVTGPHTGTLIAEYALAVFFIMWTVFTSKDTYVNAMSTAMWRLTALTFLFFVLALVDHGGRPGKAAVAFGALIDLGVIFSATNQNVIGSIGNVLSGQGQGVSTTAALKSAGGSDEPPHILAS
jgi:hypothetical protein